MNIKKNIYPKLALTGMVKNKRTYVPYLMTCICMIFVSYLLNFLRENKRISEIRGGSTLQAMLSLGSGIFCIFALIFLFYTNSFLIKRRKREFGLYNILGMGKRNIAGILVCESALMLGISLVGGLGLGILFSKLGELCMIKVLGGEISYAFSVEISTVLETVILFAVIFGLILLNSLRQIRMSDPIELLHGGAKGEKQPKGNWFLAAAGLIMLGIAYDLAVTTENPITALKTFFLAVLLVIVATYLLFIAGSVVLCRILKRNRNYYYQAKHFVSVSSMMYRMKRNGVGLASICILSTMVLVMVSSTICLYSGKEKALKQQYPRDIQVKTYTLDEDRLKGIHDAILMGEKESGIEEKDLLRYRCLIVGGSLEEDRVIMSVGDLLSASDAVDYSKITEIVYVPLEDYNRLTGNEETLNQDEVLLCCTREGTYDYDTISVEGLDTMKIKAQVPEFVVNGDVTQVIMSAIYLVVPDLETFEKADAVQKQIYGNNASKPYEYYGFNTEGGEKQQLAAMQAIWKRVNEETVQIQEEWKYSVSCIANERAYFYGMYGGLFVLGIILGSVFIVAAVLIMYYKQITEGYEDSGRFEVMQKIGMTKKEIKKSINSQMLTVFFAPLLMAGLHLIFAFPFVYRLLMMFGLYEKTFLLEVTGVCYLVFAVFYVVVYGITSRAYYRIVSAGEAR